MFYVTRTKECRGKKNVCPFLLLENSRPLSPWGPPDFLSTCLGISSLIAQGTLKSLHQHHSSKRSILLTLSFLYSPTLTFIHDIGKIIALTRQTFFGKVMSLVFNMLSRLVIAFLPRSKHLLISWILGMESS